MVISEAALLRILDRTEPDGDCLIWTGPPQPDGYGIIHLSSPRRNWRVHRAVWAYHNGPIPPGMVVMHSCDRPLCVAIAHLSVGTPADNTADMLAKGRASGNKNASGLCRNGLHPWVPENIWTPGDGRDRCKQCALDRNRRNLRTLRDRRRAK